MLFCHFLHCDQNEKMRKFQRNIEIIINILLPTT